MYATTDDEDGKMFNCIQVRIKSGSGYLSISKISKKLTYLVTLFDLKLQIFQNSPEWTTFGIFNDFLYFQNVNIARSLAVFKIDTFSVIFKKLGFDKRNFI